MRNSRYLFTQSSANAASVDQGLRAYFLKIYNYMTIGLGLTGVIAYFTAQSPELIRLIFTTPLQWVVLLAPLGVVIYLSSQVDKIAPKTAQLVFFAYAALMGLSLSSLFVVYTGASIARVFFITSATFGAMSLYGYTTKKDLTGVGSFLIMGLWGLIIASVVNIFMHSSGLNFVISLIGVIIFTGLTAYDTQRLKGVYYMTQDAAMYEKTAIYGALQLYMDFINLFLMMMRFLGDRR